RMTKFETSSVTVLLCILCVAGHPATQHSDAPSVKITADFWRAISKPDAAKVRELLLRDARLAQAREKEHGNTALHIAPNVEIAEALLASGADVEAVDTAHFATPLRWAAGDRRW